MQFCYSKNTLLWHPPTTEGETHKTRFIWKEHPEADSIVRLGVDHKDFPSEIKFALDQNGINPMPTHGLVI